MSETLLEKLEQMLSWKKGKAYYAAKLNISIEELNELWDEIHGKEEKTDELIEEIRKFNNDKGTMESTVISAFEPKNDEELAKLHKVDLSKYKISTYWTKQRGDKFTSSLLCSLISPSGFSQDRWEKFLKGYKSPYVKIVKEIPTEGKTVVNVELSLADVHLDKMDVTAENVDKRKSQYLDVLADLLNSTTIYNVNYLTFVLGNDLLHTDTFQGTTTKGTPLDISTTWFNAYEQGFDLMVKAINMCRQYAKNVEVILVQGNHSRTKEYYLAHALDVYYKNDSHIYFDRDPNTTKYTVLGNTFIGYHHGNCKLDDLPLVFATNVNSSKDFGESKYREVHTGDKHHYMTKEVKGVRIQQMPSLAGTDQWHQDNNFVNNIRCGILTVYHPINGRIAEFESRI